MRPNDSNYIRRSKLNLELNQLNPNISPVVDYFTVYDQAVDQVQDRDLGSGGLVILDLKDNSGAIHKLVTIAGKDLKIYVANRDNLGKKGTTRNSGIYQVSPPGVMPQEVFGPGAFLNGAMYWGPRGNPIEKFVFSNANPAGIPLIGTSPAGGWLSTAPPVKSTITFPVLGTVPATSAFINSAGAVSGGLVWAIGLSSSSTGGATLYAFDPGTLAARFTSPPLASQGTAKPGTKFSVPTVANSKVYVGTKKAVFAFAGTATSSNSAVDMTSNSNVQLTFGPIVQGTGGAFSQTVTVTNLNNTMTLFMTPLSLVCDKLSPTATLLSAAGATTNPLLADLAGHLASPYQYFPLSGPLAPGASVSLTLQFLASGSTAITYTPRLLDGLGFR